MSRSDAEKQFAKFTAEFYERVSRPSETGVFGVLSRGAWNIHSGTIGRKGSSRVGNTSAFSLRDDFPYTGAASVSYNPNEPNMSEDQRMYGFMSGIDFDGVDKETGSLLIYKKIQNYYNNDDRVKNFLKNLKMMVSNWSEHTATDEELTEALKTYFADETTEGSIRHAFKNVASKAPRVLKLVEKFNVDMTPKTPIGGRRSQRKRSCSRSRSRSRGRNRKTKKHRAH